MTYFCKILALILFPGFLLSKVNCFAQYYDSSALINAALGLYYELPSGTLITRRDDSLNKKLRFKKITRNLYQQDTLKLKTITKYNEIGTISSVVTKFNTGTDSLVLTIDKNTEKSFKFSFSFPFEAIKDTMDFGFAEVIDSIGLHERRYYLKVGMQVIDSVTAENFIVSINNRFIEKRSRINLFPFLTPYQEDTNNDSTRSRWNATFENGYLIKTHIDSSYSGVNNMDKKYYHPNVNRIIKHEYYSKYHGENWKLRNVIDFFYDSLGRITKRIQIPTWDNNPIFIDSLSYYPNSNLRSRKIHTPDGNFIFRDSVFSIEGKLIYLYICGKDYFYKAGEMVYEDTFYNYNKFGNILQLRRYYNGKLTDSEEFEYEYWKE